MIDDTHLSRVVSHALRHRPDRYDLRLDAAGWATVADLIAALRRHRPGWTGLGRADLERMVARSDKPRFELEGDRIRARYGHSLPVDLARAAEPPPPRLYHGTTPAAAGRILTEGLRPMGRQYVHLSDETTTARQVGARRARQPVVLAVRAAEAAAAGVRFYRGGPGIWLADRVPPAFVEHPAGADLGYAAGRPTGRGPRPPPSRRRPTVGWAPGRRTGVGGSMASERFLVTGAFGCIGAWAVKRLVDEGVPVATYDLPGEPHRLKLLMAADDLAKVEILTGDITDDAGFDRAVVDHGISHILHLAALQVPFVRANPILGARVNVVGTTIVLETARQHADQVKGLVYASSIAVYGPAASYPPGPLAHEAPLAPTTLYGVTKQANEQTAAIYWQDWQVPSVGLRPFFVYGPGRDQGVSSTPTKAMVAAAVGRPYRISFGGRALYQHADDVAAVFIAAARSMPQGAPVYNIGGTSATMAEVVAAIETAVPEAAGTITFDPTPMFTPEGVDGSRFEQDLIGPYHWRPLPDGVRQTISHVRAAAAAGTLDVERALA